MTLKVLIPEYNCEQWIERCVISALNQTVPAEILVVDDASTDRTVEVLSRLRQVHEFQIVVNASNQKCPHNIWKGVQLLDADPDDVIFILDGDDFLPDNRVFEYIESVFVDPDVWLTYGSYEPWPPNTEPRLLIQRYPAEVEAERSFRQWNIWFNHPIVFRKHLFATIPVQEFQDDHGNWLRGAYDQAIMYPMLELGVDHYRCLDEILYCYNAANPSSDNKVNLEDCQVAAEIIRSRPPFRKLT